MTVSGITFLLSVVGALSAFLVYHAYFWIYHRSRNMSLLLDLMYIDQIILRKYEEESNPDYYYETQAPDFRKFLTNSDYFGYLSSFLAIESLEVSSIIHKMVNNNLILEIVNSQKGERKYVSMKKVNKLLSDGWQIVRDTSRLGFSSNDLISYRKELLPIFSKIQRRVDMENKFCNTIYEIHVKTSYFLMCIYFFIKQYLISTFNLIRFFMSSSWECKR